MKDDDTEIMMELIKSSQYSIGLKACMPIYNIECYINLSLVVGASRCKVAAQGRQVTVRRSHNGWLGRCPEHVYQDLTQSHDCYWCVATVILLFLLSNLHTFMHTPN